MFVALPWFKAKIMSELTRFRMSDPDSSCKWRFLHGRFLRFWIWQSTSVDDHLVGKILIYHLTTYPRNMKYLSMFTLQLQIVRFTSLGKAYNINKHARFLMSILMSAQTLLCWTKMPALLSSCFQCLHLSRPPEFAASDRQSKHFKSTFKTVVG